MDVMRSVSWLVVLVVAAGCGDDEDAPSDAAVGADAALAADAAVPDPDAGSADAAVDDGAITDASVTDAQSADGTVAGYTVTMSAAVYQQLTGGTAITLMDSAPNNPNDDGVGSLSIPFAFDFYRAPLTTLLISPNGFAATTGLTAPGGAQNTSFPMTALPNGLLAPWWEDLTVDPAIIAGSALTRAVLGTAPSRVLVVEWTNVRLSAHTTSNHRRFNFQLALFETSHVIEYRYGETLTSGNPATATSASVGIEDPTGTTGQNLLPCTPACAGPPRPTNPDGFPRATVIRLTPM